MTWIFELFVQHIFTFPEKKGNIVQDITKICFNKSKVELI